MNPNEVELKIQYESQPEETFKCKKNEKFKEICNKVANKFNIEVDLLYFITKGKTFGKNYHDKELNELFSENDLNDLHMLAFKAEESELLKLNDKNENMKIRVVLWFESEPHDLFFFSNNTIEDISKLFCNGINKSWESLQFKCREKILNLNTTLSEILTQSDKDKKQIDIHVEEKEEENTFFQKYKIIIIFILSFIVLVIIIVIIIIALKRKKTKDNNNIADNDGCLSFANSTSTECLLCEEEFIVNNGKCIPYMFYGTYQIDFYFENVKLFNPNKIADLFMIKIDEDILNPIFEFNFEKIENKKVYYYFLGDNPISFSNMFENNTKLIDFSFNDKYINNYNINDMKGMFKGCISLTSI